MKHWILYCQMLLAFTISLSMPTSAYTISPSIVSLNTTGNQSGTFLRLGNKGKAIAAVELNIYKHSKDIDGKSIKGADANEDFIIHPHQVVMMPGDEVTVQLLWIGEPELDAEQAYTIVTREISLPTKATDEPDLGSEPSTALTMSIKVLINYEGRVYVAPPGAKPKAIIASVKEYSDSVGQEIIEVFLENQGTAHKPTRWMNFIFIPLDPMGARLKQQAVTIPSSEISGMRPHLLPGTQRRVLIPRPSGLPLGKFDVLLSE